MRRVRRVPESKQLEMIRLYQAGLTMKAAAERAGYSEGACFSALRRNGIPSRLRGDGRRRYHLDQSFFDRIDSEEKAYWLGFFTADGGIVRRSLVLHLQAGDAGHLEKFRVALAANYPITSVEDRGRRYARLVLYSRRLTQALECLGIAQNKSLNVRPCINLPALYMPDYWRGVVDGDGWISPHGPRHWEVGLSGSYALVSGFQSFLLGHIQSRARPSAHKRIWTICFGGIDLPRRILHVLYKSAHIYLDRKMALARQVLREVPEPGVWPTT